MKEIFLITFIITVIWDVIGAPQDMANRLARWLTNGKIRFVEIRKPLGCSLCMVFWTTLIYQFTTGMPEMAIYFTSKSILMCLCIKPLQKFLTSLESILDTLFFRLDKLNTKLQK